MQGIRRRQVLTTITRDELRAKLDRGDDVVLVEALPEETFQHAHLPGAVNLPPERVGELAPELLPDKGVEIVVYCSDPACPHSEEAARELAEMGYKNVKDYVEGKVGWMRAGLPTEGSTASDEPARGEEDARPSWWHRIFGG